MVVALKLHSTCMKSLNRKQQRSQCQPQYQPSAPQEHLSQQSYFRRPQSHMAQRIWDHDNAHADVSKDFNLDSIIVAGAVRVAYKFQGL